MTNVFITGGSSGMGLSHAVYLTSKGYNVTATYLPGDNIDPQYLKNLFIADNSKYKYSNKEKTIIKRTKFLLGKKFADNLDDFISKIKYLPMNVTSDESVSEAIQKAGTIDILINNAGIGYFGPIEDLDMQKAKNQLEINFFGYLRVLKQVIPQMRERQKGQIINVSSLAGVLYIPFQTHYSASKAGILRMTEGLKIELKPFNIKVSAVLPSDINTSFNARMALLHTGGELQLSTEISLLKDTFPVSKDSPYYDPAKRAWKAIIENLIISPPPIVVSKKILKIIKAKKPKIHYKAGMRFQTYGLTLMKRLFPENLTVSIMAMLYS